jgi:hypothetical protein
VTFTGESEYEADTFFRQLGVNLAILAPGEPNSSAHTARRKFYQPEGIRTDLP